MNDLATERELDALLAEQPEDAHRRAAGQFAHEGSALALYGAGNLGRLVLERLRQVGVEPVAFADDTPAKQGLTIDGLPVLPPQTVAARYGARALFVVTILNPFASFAVIKSRLAQLTGPRVISFLDLAWRYPDQFLPHYQFELPQAVLSKAADIRRALHLFADEESRRQFVAHIRFRLRLDFDALPTSNMGDYFPADVLPPLPAEVTFVDCGAFDGDTVRRFLAHQRGMFREIYAFEPDPTNCAQLREYIAALGPNVSGRIHIYQAAVGASRARLGFSAIGTTGAALAPAGETMVDVLPLSEIVPADTGLIYLKLDVEGAEREALAGAESLIRQARPLIAISVYHRPDDLWQLPLCLAELGLGYRFYLRTQGEDGMDIVCYAVPAADAEATA